MKLCQKASFVGAVKSKSLYRMPPLRLLELRNYVKKQVWLSLPPPAAEEMLC